MSFMYTADWTNHTESVTGKPGFQVLLRVDESTYEPVREFFQDRGGKAMGKDHPIAWTNTLNGRFFYMRARCAIIGNPLWQATYN